MTLLGFLQLIPSIFKFADEIKWLIQTLQGTPEEHHEALMAKMASDADVLAKTGRPVWD